MTGTCAAQILSPLSLVQLTLAVSTSKLSQSSTWQTAMSHSQQTNTVVYNGRRVNCINGGRMLKPRRHSPGGVLPYQLQHECVKVSEPLECFLHSAHITDNRLK